MALRLQSPPLPRVLFLGGNGHCAARLAPAQTVLAESNAPRFTLQDVLYPGFEERPRARDWPTFLAVIGQQIREAAAPGGPMTLYATGIGGLIALGLRAAGEGADIPLIMQGPVLWGLEHRLFPRLMRLPLVPRLLPLAFASPFFQNRFARQHFSPSLTPAQRRVFFAGYNGCRALPDFFRWLTPPLLRGLEAAFAQHPERLRNITLWWGGRDRVVTLQELRWTENALGIHWPVRTFPAWGHYPMLDDPAGWVSALAEAVTDA